ncbi:MAG TPA: hypothetical protein PLD25_24185, partial [Chloroflexota bacterium]|nr:hypothetical protein [Chloroflexota bacterium]
RYSFLLVILFSLYCPVENTQIELPARIFGNLIGTGEHRTVILQNALDKERVGLLVYVSEKRGWRTAHYTIAHEICKQIIGGSIEGGENWKHHLANWAIEYIQYFGALNLNSDRQHSDFVIDLMEEMFISRNAINLDTTKKTGSFARPIIDIQTKEGELAVLQCLADSFENQPHFRAHYARMLSQQGRHKEAQIEARKAAKIQSHDRVLHHILGIVLRKDIYEIMLSVERDKRRRVEIDDQRLIDIENLFQEAESSFARAREIDIEHEHSYTSHAEMLIRAVEFGFKLSDKKTYKEFFSDQKLSKYHEMVDKAENLLAVAKKLYESSTPSSYLVSCENRIDEFFSNDYQSIIRNWRKMLDTSASDVHAPTIRRRIIRLHLAKNGRYWDDMPVSELEDTLILTEQNILEEPENDWNVRLWFEAARRLPDVSVDLAIDRLTSLQARNDTVEILYYLYILQTLKAIDGSYVAKERAEKLMEECHKRILPLSLADQKFRYNWLGTEEGLPRIVYFKKLGKLNEQDWFKYDDDKILARIPGKVAKISSPKAGWVELRCGLRAFFTPGHERDARSHKGSPLIEGFVKGRDENIDVDFYLGFSYDGLRAYEVKKVEL